MPPFDQIISALISLVIGTLLGSEITRWLYRPRVYIRYEDIAPLYAEDGVHWTIRVANLGRTVATNCKCIITIDSLDESDLLDVNEAFEKENLPEYREEKADLSFPRTQTLSPNYFREISGESLAWATLGNPAVISINPGITEMLDVFKVQDPDKGGYISMPTEYGWRRLRARIKPRDLTGRVLVCPSNEFPTLIFFRLAFDASGKSSFYVRRPSPLKRLQRIFFRRRYYFG